MAGTSEAVTMRMKKNVLSWFGHVERMSDERMAKKIYEGKVGGEIDRGRPRLTFEKPSLHVKTMRTFRRTCTERLMIVGEAKEVCRDRNIWRSVLSDYPTRDAA